MKTKNPQASSAGIGAARLWTCIPLKRTHRELLKSVFFSSFPCLFKRWRVYKNWKNARAFCKNRANYRWLGYQNEMLANSFTRPIALPKDSDAPVRTYNKLAVYVHVYFPKIFPGIISRLLQTGHENLSLYITVPQMHLDTVKAILKETPLIIT